MVEKFIHAAITYPDGSIKGIKSISGLKSILKGLTFPLSLSYFGKILLETLDPIKQLRWKHNEEMYELNIQYEYVVFSRYEENQVFTETEEKCCI